MSLINSNERKPEKVLIALVSSVNDDIVEISLCMKGIKRAIERGAFKDGDSVSFMISRKDIATVGSNDIAKIVVHKTIS
jgi:hypothetical protein